MREEIKVFSKKILIIAATAFFISFPGCQRQKGEIPPDTEAITISGLQKHMNVLTSDEMEGRLTGSSGYKIAADYAAEQFASFTLEPGWPDGNKKSFLQPVPFIHYRFGSNNALTIQRNGKTKEYTPGRKSYELLYPGEGNENIPLSSPVFIGYGIHEPELGWDDYAGLDVGGKIAILMMGFSPRNSDIQMPMKVRRKYSDRIKGDLLRFSAAIEKNAAAIIVIPDESFANNWDRIMSQRKRFNFVASQSYGPSSPGEPPIPVVVANRDLVGRVFDKKDFNPIEERGDYATFVMDGIELGLTVNASKEYFTCYNIIALLPGTDPKLDNEYIAVAAHLDHLGKNGFIIYRGANDDASGCSLILEVAQALAQNPAKRPVMFILFTAEEAGHYGSLHFLEYPPVPLEQIALNINIEQIGSKHRNVKGIWAIGPPSQRDLLYSAHQKVKSIDLNFDNIDSQLRVIQGSDTWSFYLQKVPAIILGSGGFPEHHTPGDTIDLIDFDHLYKATLLVYEYILELGNK
ncbi:MAG: M20/M25/M40 family metallo-hydrolase [Candidatus Aminicenantes bacterium]|nr:MAG: M20/M25/M40 family metallo-hydrolase [Candidatus Aminicenantes bacterium]